MRLKIFYDNTTFRLKDWNRVKKTLIKVIGSADKVAGDLNFILTSDESLHKINIEFLKHDYFTDVITFSYQEGDIINGEVYISMDTVNKNAFDYDVSLRDEVIRVMIHGVLHLVGYNDETALERKKMRAMEDHWLQKEKKEEV